MKKNLLMLTSLLIILFATSCSGDDDSPYNGYPPMTDPEDVCTSMDDINFMKFCYENYDVNGDGKVSISEAKAVDKMEVSSRNIKSILGIQYFENLIELYLSSDEVASLDISKNLKLKELTVGGTSITTFDMSKNLSLETLYVSGSITSLDVSKNLNLKTLYISAPITSLDVSKNKQLGGLFLLFTKITTLDISSNLNLNGLSIDFHSLIGEGIYHLDDESSIEEVWLAKGQVLGMVLGKNTVVKYK